MKVFSLITGILLLAAGTPSPGAESLDQAWQAALSADRQLQSARSLEQAAEQNLAAARAERRPRVTLSTSATRLDSAPAFSFGDAFRSPPLFDDDLLLMGGAQLQLPLFTGGAIASAIASAQSSHAAGKAGVQSARQDLRLAVVQAYVNVLRARSAVAVADSNVASLEAQTRDAENQFEFGSVPRNDYLAAAVSLADARQRQLQAANQLELAHAAYNRQLQRDLSSPVDLAADLPDPLQGVSLDSLDSLIATALDHRSELQALSARRQALAARSRAERARLRPQVGLTGGYSRLETQVLDDDGFWMIGVGVNWSLFDGGRIRSRASALESQAAAVGHSEADLRSRIALQVRSARLNLDESSARVVVASKAVEQSEENLRVSRDRYLAGSGTSTEVLDAEALRARSMNNRDNAHFDEILARFRLARALGVL
ncbi:MAG: TolC family protein [Xanthomonadales bacterium]|nr:TolC family protein [Xanthomonadales bacterium]